MGFAIKWCQPEFGPMRGGAGINRVGMKPIGPIVTKTTND